MKLLKFNEWTSWRDDLYDEPEKGDPEIEYKNQLKKKEEEEEEEIKKEKSKKSGFGNILVSKNWKKREVEELTDKYQWCEQELKEMKLI